MNTELEDNIKSALSSNPALRDKILALIPAKNSVVTPDTEWEKEFVEKGADLEHTRWAKWQAYLHSKCVEHENGKGEWVCFPAELYRRWERQINTPYAELSEVEKESDRKEVRSYLPLLTSRDTYWKERVREIIKCKRCNGQGGYLGASLGYSECEDCGGDGHCLYNREEEKLDTLLDNLK